VENAPKAHMVELTKHQANVKLGQDYFHAWVERLFLSGNTSFRFPHKTAIAAIRTSARYSSSNSPFGPCKSSTAGL